MRFNSVTGRAALSARGGHASARYHASTGWRHQKRIAALAVIARARQALVGRVSHTDSDCRRATGLGILEVARLYEAGVLEDYHAELTRRERAYRERNRTPGWAPSR